MSESSTQWETVPLDQICDVNPHEPGPQDRLTEVSFIPMPAVSDTEGIILNHGTKPFAEVAKGYTRFRDGDVIFAKITPCMENGKIALASGLHGGSACGSTEFHVLRSRGSVLPRYLWYFLRQKQFRTDAERHMTGAVGQRRVPAQYLKTSRIPLPSIRVQRDVVVKLDALVKKTRIAREELGRIPRLVERYRSAILNAAFRGHLTQKWRALNPSPSPDKKKIAEERRYFKPSDHYQPPDAELTVDPPFGIPPSWRWSRAEAVCDLITKGTTPPKSEMAAGSGDVPYVKVYNLTFDGTLDFGKDPTFVSKRIHSGILQRSRVVPGDVLMNIVGPPLGKVSIVPNALPEWNINQAIAVFRPVPSVDSRFLALWLLSKDLLAWTGSRSKATAGQSNLTLQICRDIPIPLCSQAEQMELIRLVENGFDRVDEVSSRAKRALDLVNRLDHAVLREAFRGGLVL
jgi:type I restriction enzyme S subunit